MFRLLCSPSVRVALPLARSRTLPRAIPFVRTVVTTRYTKEHEWISYDSETKLGTVSITDHAQQNLGEVVFVELKEVGTLVSVGDQLGAVESVKAASDIYAPVSGIVKEINSTLKDSPSLINNSPQGDGWLCKLVLSDPKELDKLLTEEQYTKHCESDSSS